MSAMKGRREDQQNPNQPPRTDRYPEFLDYFAIVVFLVLYWITQTVCAAQ